MAKCNDEHGAINAPHIASDALILANRTNHALTIALWPLRPEIIASFGFILSLVIHSFRGRPVHTSQYQSHTKCHHPNRVARKCIYFTLYYCFFFFFSSEAISYWFLSGRNRYVCTRFPWCCCVSVLVCRRCTNTLPPLVAILAADWSRDNAT